MTKSRSSMVLLLGAVLAGSALLAGCAPTKETIRVGSKEYTEQLVLGQITLLALENAGYAVEDKTGVAGSNKVRSALIAKEIDVYWEYTGTGWLSHLQHANPLTQSQVCYESVRDEDRKNGIEWLPYAPFNNTYTVMMRKDHAAALGIQTLSQLGAYLTANPGKLSFAVDHEFTARSDGLPGLETTYGFKMAEDKTIVMDNAIVYKALKESQADIGMGFSTDGRIQAFGLVNIEDDKAFFPAYNPSPNVRTDFADKNPKIVELLGVIAAKLDNAAIMKMNYLVDIEQKVPRDVAQAWMKEVGLLP
ncbi:MAG: glycine betaine ABC transporter substrate-binding protein [Spirochaetales bacterium]